MPFCASSHAQQSYAILRSVNIEWIRGVGTGYRYPARKAAMTFLSLAVTALATAAAADPVEGIWKTQSDDTGHYGRVTISDCGETHCGVITLGFGAAGRPVQTPTIGRRMLWVMLPGGRPWRRQDLGAGPGQDRHFPNAAGGLSSGGRGLCAGAVPGRRSGHP